MNSKPALLYTVCIILLIGKVYGQDISVKRSLSIMKTDVGITIDGIIDEGEWSESHFTQPFWEQFPYDTSYAEAQTEIRVMYDDDFLYVSVKCYDPRPGKNVTPSLRRDYGGRSSDGITLIFDPFKDQTSVTFFGINPFGVQREGLISVNSGGQDFNSSWDNKWYSEAKLYDGYWTAELAIPFKTLRFKGGEDTWFANFYRTDSKTATFSTWAHIPRNQSIFSPAFNGELTFEEPLKKPGLNISVIPYIAGSLGNDYVEDEELDNFEIGGDVKIGITPSLNLDLTVNPDFSQVEVDQQQSNITRFELSFPEKRQFFLENADLFSSFGESRIRPFFSRRIGIALDENTDVNVPVPINYGARLSGRINQNWRVGLMNLQTQKDESIDLPGYNYSVLAVQRQFFSRSNLSLMVINKQATHQFAQDSTLESGFDRHNYNRLIGVDYNLASDNNRWTGKLFYHYNFQEDSIKSEDFAHGLRIGYNSPAVQIKWEHQIVGDQYDPEVGFVPRNNYKRVRPELEFKLYPESGPLANHGPEFSVEYLWNKENGKTDHRYELEYQLSFRNRSSLRASIINQYTYLFDDFDPFEEVPLPEGSDYNYTSIRGNYSSDQRKKIYFELSSQLGEFFNGEIYRFEGNLNYRFQPYGLATFNFSYNDIQFPEPFSSGKIILLGPRVDLTFTRKIFLTTFFQYNNQSDNININARIQYRYKEVSDFFLVYTENYFPGSFDSKNRALVAKLTYWLNL